MIDGLKKCEECGHAMLAHDNKCPDCGHEQKKGLYVRVVCESCGKSLNVPQRFRGRRVACPKCRDPLVVPTAAAESGVAMDAQQDTANPSAEQVGIAGFAVSCSECGEQFSVPPDWDNIDVCAECREMGFLPDGGNVLQVQRHATGRTLPTLSSNAGIGRTAVGSLGSQNWSPSRTTESASGTNWWLLGTGLLFLVAGISSAGFGIYLKAQYDQLGPLTREYAARSNPEAWREGMLATYGSLFGGGIAFVVGLALIVTVIVIQAGRRN